MSQFPEEAEAQVDQEEPIKQARDLFLGAGWSLQVRLISLPFKIMVMQTPTPQSLTMYLFLPLQKQQVKVAAPRHNFLATFCPILDLTSISTWTIFLINGLKAKHIKAYPSLSILYHLYILLQYFVCTNFVSFFFSLTITFHFLILFVLY